MSEHDLDDGAELEELRELHRQDRMPADVRQRLLSRWAHASWAPAPLELSEADRAAPLLRAPRGRFRPVAYALAGSALVAAAALISVGGAGRWLGLERDLVTLDPEAPRAPSKRSKPSGDPNRAEMRIMGWLIPNSVQRVPSSAADARACRYGFQLSPLTTASNAVLRVEYAQCRLPGAMLESAGCVKITANGYLGDDGHVEASWLMAEEVHCQP